MARMTSVTGGQGTSGFRPRMEARTSALRTLRPLAFRRLGGAIADVWHVHGDIGGGGFYIAPDARLVIFLDGTPPDMAMRTGVGHPETRGPRAMFIPAGVPLWSRLDAEQDLSHIDFHLDAGPLAQRLGRVGGGRLDQVRFLRDGPTLHSLARLAAEEVQAPRRGPMLLDGLLTALLGEIFATEPEAEAQAHRGGLSPWQAAAVEKHLRQHLTRQIPVAELAEVAGLSESWFARAFKQSFEETPQRWQAHLRLDAARDMMARPALSLSEIAQATGFADQAHLSRQFRQRFGQPPSAWRRAHFPRS
ncbi:MAG: helix-turn-helix transcriptional regulator [Rhodobacteraceae bacterium]|nr:helix-turn-helix transcriptional regulator [Paracoccaceae bacterium]MBR9823515.1 helix-turn-helix transcriptional regulator [Paracoccaceae bacterium]